MSPGPIDCTFVSNILVEGSNSANWSTGNGSFGAKSREGGHSNPSNVDQSDSIICYVQARVWAKRFHCLPTRESVVFHRDRALVACQVISSKLLPSSRWLLSIQCVLAFWSDSTGSSLSEVSLGRLVKDLPGHHFSQLRASLRSVGEGESPTVHVS